MTHLAKSPITSLLSLSLACALLTPLGCIGSSAESTSDTTADESATAASGKTSSGTTSDLSGTVTGDSTGSSTGGTTTSGGTTEVTTEGTTEGTTGDWPDWCNYFDQLCPEGTKCTFDGDHSTVQCIEIVRDPKQMGEPCSTGEGSSFDGVDDCDDNLLCWLDAPDGPTCVPFCGQEDDFTCESGMSCTTCQSCALGICIPYCDPIGDDCQEGDVCVPLTGSGDQGFGCAFDASMDKGAYLDECEYVNVCDPGLVCLDAGTIPGCEGPGCCTPFCDLNQPECPDDALVCTPWFEPEEAPEDFKHVGVCVLPEP